MPESPMFNVSSGKGYAEEDLMDNLSVQSKDSDLEDANQGWKAPKSRKSKKLKRKHVVVASRTSNRIPRDGIPIAEKASRRAMERDTVSGTTNKNPFTVLNNTSNDIFQSVMVDLDIKVDDFNEQIDVFKLEELARAAVVEANYNHFLESQKAKSAPQDEADLADLTMGVISNDMRNYEELLPKGGEGSSREDVERESALTDSYS